MKAVKGTEDGSCLCAACRYDMSYWF